jgi:hypothetical protein
MRRPLSITQALIITSLSCPIARALDLSMGIDPIAADITVSVLRQTSLIANPGYCPGDSQDPAPLECRAERETVSPKVPEGMLVGADAIGNGYHTANLEGRIYLDLGFRKLGNYLQRIRPDGHTENLVALVTDFCLDDPDVCAVAGTFEFLSPFILDSTNGQILIVARGREIIPPQVTEDVVGIIAIGGLPKLLDTLLTFVPGGQTLSILTPAHPDGFRSADAFQVWAGDVRTLPDWSQAAPMACPAASSPIPGQLVRVADTLPDPDIGQARYYLVASQSGGQRRLGRQYAGAGFSAREPAGLTVCE